MSDKPFGDVKMVSVDKIKELLSQKDGSELRIGLKNAEDMGIDFSDKSIVELFDKGIAIDVVIKNVDSHDYLPTRLESQIGINDPDQLDRNSGFVKVKIVDLLTPKIEILNPLEVSGLLMRVLDNDFKVAGYMEEDSCKYTRIRIISTKNDRFLNLKEIRYLLGTTIPKDRYEFLVDEI